MNNPWKDIELEAYENHMKLDSIMQLQALNAFMKIQLNSFPVDTAMVLGVAGGNGLEHIDKNKLCKVYGIDINQDYLTQCKNRFAYLQDILELICLDLSDDDIALPRADIVIANLLIEYIGYDCFKNVIKKVNPNYVSCAIQINISNDFVSCSPYAHTFDALQTIHRTINEKDLCDNMASINYNLIDKSLQDLPNGKRLSMLTFKK